jgi:16S rRNA (cytosine967-C5)-methyltransferase
VNAVLRGYLREFDATKTLLTELKTTQPHTGYSHPEWLVARWQKRWGLEKAAQLMEWNNTPPKTFARVNALRFDRRDELHESQISKIESGTHGTRPSEIVLKNTGDLLTQWRDENVEYDFVRRDWLEENLIFELKSHPPLAKLPSFQQGLFYIQDPSTLLAVRELNPHPGETVLDLCAAPGGKTTYIAQLMQDKGRLIAHDTSPERLKLIEENCARLGVTCVETTNALERRSPDRREDNSATKRADLEIGVPRFDRILVDAPCSNTGVMRRRVDLRWRISAEEIERLRATQLDLLKQATVQLKPGGTLVYSTCSLEPEENGDVVKQFLAEHTNFKLETQHELLPFLDNVDGAFVATLKKG